MTPNARDKELAKATAEEYAEEIFSYPRSATSQLPDLTEVIARALAKQREEFESTLGALRLQFELRGEIIKRLDAKIKDARSHAFNLLPNRTVEDAKDDVCEQVQLLSDRLTQERDRAVAEALERAAKVIDNYVALQSPAWVQPRHALEHCATAIRSLAPKVEKEET